jgi:hypothetical protein
MVVSLLSCLWSLIHFLDYVVIILPLWFLLCCASPLHSLNLKCSQNYILFPLIIFLGIPFGKIIFSSWVIIVIVTTIMIGFLHVFNNLTLTSAISSLLNVFNWTMLLLKGFFTQNMPIQGKRNFPYFLDPLEATTLNPHLWMSLMFFIISLMLPKYMYTINVFSCHNPFFIK